MDRFVRQWREKQQREETTRIDSWCGLGPPDESELLPLSSSVALDSAESADAKESDSRTDEYLETYSSSSSDEDEIAFGREYRKRKNREKHQRDHEENDIQGPLRAVVSRQRGSKQTRLQLVGGSTQNPMMMDDDDHLECQRRKSRLKSPSTSSVEPCRALITGEMKYYDANWLINRLECGKVHSRRVQSYEWSSERCLHFMESRIFSEQGCLCRMPFKTQLNGVDDRLDRNGGDYVSSMRFVDLGLGRSLLSALSSGGHFRIYDFSEFEGRWNTKVRLEYKDRMKKIRDHSTEKEDEDEDRPWMLSDLPAPMMQLNGDLNGYDCEWIGSNGNLIALGGSSNWRANTIHSRVCVNVFDVAKSCSFPFQRLSARHTRSGILECDRSVTICNLTHSDRHSHLLFGSDKIGNVFAWDLRSGDESKRKRTISHHRESGLMPCIETTTHMSRDLTRALVNVHLQLSYGSGPIWLGARKNGNINLTDCRMADKPVIDTSVWSSMNNINNNEEQKRLKDDNISDDYGMSSLDLTRGNRQRKAEIEDSLCECRGFGGMYLFFQNGSLAWFDLNRERLMHTLNNCDGIDESYYFKVNHSSHAGQSNVIDNAIKQKTEIMCDASFLSSVWQRRVSMLPNMQSRLVLSPCLSRGFSISDFTTYFGSVPRNLNYVHCEDLVSCVEPSPNLRFIVVGTLSNTVRIYQVGKIFEEDQITEEEKKKEHRKE